MPPATQTPSSAMPTGIICAQPGHLATKDTKPTTRNWPWVTGGEDLAPGIPALRNARLSASEAPTDNIGPQGAPWPQASAAAISAILPPGGVVAEGAAAWLLGYSATWHHPITVYTPTRYRGPRHHRVRYRTIDVPRHHIQLVRNIRVTTETRTAADLARNAETLTELRLLYQLLENHAPPQIVSGVLNHYLSGRNGITRARTRIHRAQKAIRPISPNPSRLVGKATGR